MALIELGEHPVPSTLLDRLAKALHVPAACLAILGSSHVPENPEATDLMRNLQELVSSVVLAQACAGDAERRHLADADWLDYLDTAHEVRGAEP